MVRGSVAVRGREGALVPRARQHGHEADGLGHAPAAHHLTGDRGDLLEIRLGPGGHVAVDDLFGGAAAQRADDPAAQIVGAVAIAVGCRALEGHAQGLTARDDRHLAHRVRARLEHAEHRVAGLVVRGALALLR